MVTIPPLAVSDPGSVEKTAASTGLGGSKAPSPRKPVLKAGGMKSMDISMRWPGYVEWKGNVHQTPETCKMNLKK